MEDDLDKNDQDKSDPSIEENDLLKTPVKVSDTNNTPTKTPNEATTKTEPREWPPEMHKETSKSCQVSFELSFRC